RRGAARHLFFSTLGDERTGSYLERRTVIAGVATRRGISVARVGGRSLHARRSGARVRRAENETLGSAYEGCCLGTPAGLENHFERRCFGDIAHRCRGVVVLQRLPVRKSRGLGGIRGAAF